jgi:hypothetical protein
MNITDVKLPGSVTVPSQDELMKAIPKIITEKVPKDQVQQMVKEGTTAPVMSSEDYSKLMEIDNLPSRNLLYPEGTKIYGKHLGVGELKKLTTVTESNVNVVINDIIRSSIKGINFEDILTEDKLYIVLWLRANTFVNSGYSVPFRCYKCDKESTFDFKVDNININHIKDKNITTEMLPLTNGDILTFKYMTVGDEIAIEKFKGSIRNLQLELDETDLTYAFMISAINGKQMWALDKLKYIKSSPEIYSQIKSWVKRHTFGVSDILSVTCNSCGGTAPAAVSFREEFVIPDFKFPEVESENNMANAV